MNPPTTVAPERSARFALFIGGLAAVGFGVAILVWPTKAAVALTGVIATYTLVAGLVYVTIGALSKNLGLGGRIGHVLLGALYFLAGAYAFSSLQRSAAFLAIFLTIMVGVMWIIEGFTALFALGQATSKAPTIIFAILSVIAGATLVGSPLWGGIFLWWFLGISMVILGALNATRSFARKSS